MLGTLRLFLASSGQQNEPADTCLHRLRTEGLNGFGCSWHGEIRIIGDVDRAAAIENRRPAARRILTGRPRSSSRLTTRRPVFPVPPSTSANFVPLPLAVIFISSSNVSNAHNGIAIFFLIDWRQKLMV